MNAFRFVVGLAVVAVLGFSPPVSADVSLTFGFRETFTFAGLGEDGGTVNDHNTGQGIEWVGATGTVGGAPQDKPVPADGAWHTVEFNFFTDPIMSFAGGNGIFFTRTNRGPMEHLGITSTGDAGPLTMYIDNIEWFGPSIPGLPPNIVPITGFEEFADGSAVMFRDPGFNVPDNAPSTENNVVGSGASAVTSEAANDGNKSLKVDWEFTDDALSRWIRLSTWSTDSDPLTFGNPTIITPSGNAGVRLDVLLIPEPATGALLVAASGLLLRRRRSKSA